MSRENNIYDHAKKVLFVAFFAFSISAYSKATENVYNFKLKTCNSKSCYLLKTSKASRGFLDSIYVLNRLQLLIKNNKTKKVQTVNASSGIYDPELDMVHMQAPTDWSPAQPSELIVHLKTGVIEEFK